MNGIIFFIDRLLKMSQKQTISVRTLSHPDDPIMESSS
jgi:hypothetical protein